MIYVEWCDAKPQTARAVAGKALEMGLDCIVSAFAHKVQMLFDDEEHLARFCADLPAHSQHPVVCFETNKSSLLSM